jgi:hypothetical protein
VRETYFLPARPLLAPIGANLALLALVADLALNTLRAGVA